MNKKYRVSEFGLHIGRSASTVRRWDREGRLVAKRTASGQRYYEQEDIQKALKIDIPDVVRQVVVYCRVSSRGQMDDLKSQVSAMETFCLGRGVAVDEWLEEVSGGMNFKRKKFNLLIERIENGEISQLIIAHRDRFVRFGFEFFSTFAARHGCEIIVANQESQSPQEEMITDLMSVVHTFSCRLYGLRSYKKQIEKAAKSDG